ncbi:MAG: hypothetical protein HQL84_03920 [Magnetococcales bacterium]|nr:hypothetical protein [Magnetococcales bacterium]MBF0149173.1 hypothetical protein [Magnetococcales bacterium]
MSNIVKVQLDEETTFYAEVEDRPENGLQQASPSMTEQVSATVSEGLASMRPVVQKVMETFRDLGPEECQVEFGLKINGEVGIFVSKGGAEAQIKVTMKWKRDPRS